MVHDLIISGLEFGISCFEFVSDFVLRISDLSYPRRDCIRSKRMAGPPKAPLIPKLRGQFAEFLRQRSLERLRIFFSPTCVSFSTGGRFQPIEAFLGYVSKDFGIINGLALAGRSKLADRSPSTQRHSNRPPDRCRNINLPSIRYAFRPRVRVRLTLGGFTFPRKP